MGGPRWCNLGLFAQEGKYLLRGNESNGEFQLWKRESCNLEKSAEGNDPEVGAQNMHDPHWDEILASCDSQRLLDEVLVVPE